MMENQTFIANLWPILSTQTDYYEGTLSTSTRLIFLKNMISSSQKDNRMIFIGFIFYIRIVIIANSQLDRD